MINIDDIKAGYTLGHADAGILRGMVKELLAYRQAFSEPVGKVYFDSYYGARVSLDKSNKLADGEVLYRKPTIPGQEI